eukprot:m.75616 g.75616  ORF g.75616 m.75616 type:complete len:116 (-) comp12454_c0_seq1:108-455(-)
MADPRLRQFKIKTGVLKRLGKEREVNFKEVALEVKRIQKFKDEGRDEYDIKKQYEVLEECKMMIPHTQQRLEAAHQELSAMLDAEVDLAESAEYKDAKAMVEFVPIECPEPEAAP